MEYDMYGEPIGPKKPEHMQELQMRLQKMYSGIKSHTKAIRAAQTLTDEMAAGHYPDENNFGLDYEHQFAAQSPQRIAPLDLEYSQIVQLLQQAGVAPRSTQIWHKNVYFT